MSQRKAILIITDGIGCNPDSDYNAFAAAHKPTYERLFASVPHALIRTAGAAVGLPEGQMGNSEVGHMTLGAGRVLEQNLVRISHALADGRLASNPILGGLLAECRRIHVIGLLSDGGVHSHIDHILGLIAIARQAGRPVCVHAITDGRDVPPRCATGYLHRLADVLDDQVMLASLGGRFYAMDRDHRWPRVERGYQAIVNATPNCPLDPFAYIEQQYQRDIGDEFIEPVAFGDYAGFHDGDGVIFANFRSDRMKEIVSAIGLPGFAHFRRRPVDVSLVTMTRYDKQWDIPVLFPPEHPDDTLGALISQAGLRQFHTAETEKYAHVTYFFNGGHEAPYPGEERLLVPSPQVKTYDLKPDMSAEEVGDAVLTAITDGFEFILVNFANGDMVGHTGDFTAAVSAVETVDRQLGRITTAANEAGYAWIITSDHGNVERMQDDSGHPLTSHTNFDVWCFVHGDGVREVRGGGLSNIAATVLKLMGLPRPEAMDPPLV